MSQLTSQQPPITNNEVRRGKVVGEQYDQQEQISIEKRRLTTIDELTNSEARLNMESCVLTRAYQLRKSSSDSEVNGFSLMLFEHGVELKISGSNSRDDVVSNAGDY